MSLTTREFWGLVHGVVLGGLFLLAFAGGLAGLYSLRPEWITVEGMRERMRRLDFGTWLMAIVAWLTVITGTYIVYPWYRAAPPEGADLREYPRYFLLDNENLAAWHTFGMEWKEHVAWFAPILATAVAFTVWRYRDSLAENARLRNMLIVLFVLAFAAAAIAGLFGALITKAAPIL
ncbi:MAG TPA: hypothetical protein VNK95_00110 [Caldilineaceae bacterium]|nr:hypothetical protein [Caldilineaceae bacterium]